MLRLVVLIVAVAACGPAPRPAAPGAGPPGSGSAGELDALPARTAVAVVIADPAAAAPLLTDARDLGGDELAGWIAPRFAGVTWPLPRLADAGLDPRGPVAVARLDDDAGTLVRVARVADGAALTRVVEQALRASKKEATRSRVGDVAVIASGDDALVVRDGRAYFVASGARSQRDRAAVEIAAGDAPALGPEIAGVAEAAGVGALIVVGRGDAARALIATDTPITTVVAALSQAPDALVARVAVTPVPTAKPVELGLPVAPPEAAAEAPAPTWPARPRDENPDVPLSAEYRAVTAQLDALDVRRAALTRTIEAAEQGRDVAVDRAFATRSTWQPRGAIAVADLRIALPGGRVSTAVARARDAARPLLERREQAIAESREAIAAYQRLVDQLVHVRARDVAAHDRGR